MKLADLISVLPEAKMPVQPNCDVVDLVCDSRAVGRGSMFIAIKGTSSDGHDYIEAAVDRGAIACVSETGQPALKVPNIIVQDSRKALALLAARFFGNPADSLTLFGVTGTNGKTSTVHLLKSIIDASSWGKAGVIGTVGHGSGGNLEPALHTTPDAVKLHSLFKDMLDDGCRGVVMEVSSHAVRQQRTWGIEFEVGIITNVTRDHLDYHKTFENYMGAKKTFCISLAEKSRKKPPGTLAYFQDNDTAGKIGREFSGNKISVGLSRNSDVYAEQIEADLRGTGFVLRTPREDPIPISLKLLGRFSVYNSLMAAAAALAAGIEIDHIKNGLEALQNIPGRFEALGGGERPVVIVDYCHTPDSLERMLKFCLNLAPRRLITVFGCGGDRDKGKRPIMGRIAQALSSFCYVTSDNPRTEDPGMIINDIVAGMKKTDDDFLIMLDRKEAIGAAVGSAGIGDLVAICGKGHEDYQILENKRIHFDDKEEAEKALSVWSRN